MMALLDVSHSFHKSYFIFKKTQPNADLNLEKYRNIFVRKVIIDLVASVNKLHRVDEVYFCFDDHSWRKTKSGSYKSDREDKDEGFHECLNTVHDLLLSKGFNSFRGEGAEADDAIAFVCSATDQTQEIIIISADKDMHQLISDNVSVWNNNLKNPVVYINRPNEKLYLGLRYTKEVIDPKFSIIEKIVLGCPTDNVSKLIKKGIGIKAIEKYYKKYGHYLDPENPEKLCTDLKFSFIEEFNWVGQDFEYNFRQNYQLVKLGIPTLPNSVFSSLKERFFQLQDLSACCSLNMLEILSETEFLEKK